MVLVDTLLRPLKWDRLSPGYQWVINDRWKIIHGNDILHGIRWPQKCIPIPRKMVTYYVTTVLLVICDSKIMLWKCKKIWNLGLKIVIFKMESKVTAVALEWLEICDFPLWSCGFGVYAMVFFFTQIVTWPLNELSQNVAVRRARRF